MVAIDAFLASVQTKALRIAELSLRDREDALDVVQDAMYKFVQKYARKPEEQWPALFYRILYNRIIDSQRQRSRSQTRFLSIFSLNSDKNSEDDPLDRIASEQPIEPERFNQSQRFAGDLEQALLELPERQRQAFLLREWEGLNVDQTASAMGCSGGSVKTHLSRARKALQKRLQQYV